jgi:hypothetical protein
MTIRTNHTPADTRNDVTTEPHSTPRRSRRTLAHLSMAVGLVAGAIAISVYRGADAERRVTTRAFIAVMCKFADNANGYNFTSADIDTMFNGSPYGLDGLVREMSLGEANLAGSKAVGWFTLPKARANYAPDWDGAAELTRDCAAAAVAGGVDIAPFRNIMVFLNDQLPGAEGRTVPVSIPVNGQPTDFTSVLITRRGLNSPGLVLHELGHVFGGKHTNSITDPLGGAAFYGERPDLNPNNPRRVNVGPGWDASNRDAMGWIPANRKTAVASGTQTITLTRLTQPGPNGMMLVDVPIGATGERYVVAARTRVGYDSQQTSNNTLQFGYLLRVQGVVIEKVSPTADTTTVWSNPGGNRESPDSIWSTGQTFTDPTGIRITVDRFDDTGAQVTITNGSGAPPATTAAPTTVAPTVPPTAPPTAPPTTAAPVVTTTTATNAPVVETTVPATAAPTVTPTVPPTAPPPPPTPTGGRPTDTFAGLPLLAVPTNVPGFSTAGFGVDAGEPANCNGIGATVWFKVTAPASGTLTVSTAGSDYDTVFSVYSGPPAATSFGELGYFGCVDDAPGTSQAEFTGPVTPGSTIYVQVGGYAGASGNLVIAVR